MPFFIKKVHKIKNTFVLINEKGGGRCYQYPEKK